MSVWNKKTRTRLSANIQRADQFISFKSHREAAEEDVGDDHQNAEDLESEGCQVYLNRICTLFIFHPDKKMAKTRTMSMIKSIPTEHRSPFELTEIGVNGELGSLMYSMRKNRSQGTGRPTQTSKMFEPTELETAMSPRPLRATITLEKDCVGENRGKIHLVIKSGILVPAAKMVNPMTSVGITKVSPIVLAHQTMR